MNETIEFLKRLSRDGYYGAVTIKFEAGNVVFLKKEETLKPADLSGKPRKRNDETKWE